MASERRADERHFAGHLAEYHQALLEGRRSTFTTDLPEVQAQRLRVAQDCVDQLHAMWNRDGAPTDETLPLAVAACDETATDWHGQSIGRFRIERELGHGGAGIVLLAVDPTLDRRVALKVPRPEGLMSRVLRQRFLREAEAAARLNHPHIVKVYEVGEAGPICYIAAEYCAGQNLAAWLAELRGKVATRDAAAVVADLAAGVHHAHARGVLHRDLKPSNVLLDRGGDAEPADVAPPLSAFVAKVGDFGLAKLVEREGDETRSGTVMGTPRYMAPEQAEGRIRDIGVHTDVYALGAILYELLTGVLPHLGLSDSEMLRRVLLDEPVPPRRVRSEVPLDLQAICLKCLEKEPQQRYLSAAALEEDLRRYLAGKPTFARPVSTAGRLWKWARRRPAVAALSAVLAAALVTIFVVSIAYSARLQTALTETTREREIARASAHRSRQLLYGAEIRRAHGAWKNNRAGQVLEILNQQIPTEGEEDLREFSWYYLRGLCDRQLVTYRGHQGDVFSVAASADGRFWASAGKDGTVRLWDAASSQSRGVFEGHTDEVTRVAFSPDATCLASASEDHTVRLWSVPDGAPRGVLLGHTNHVSCLAFSPDGKWLASGSRDHSVRVWDPVKGESIVRFEPDEYEITSLAFTGRGKVLAAGNGTNGTVYCWRTGTWESLTGHSFKSGAENMRALASSPTVDWLAGGGRLNVVHLWDVADTGLRELREFSGGHSERIEYLAFSPTGETLASTDNVGVIQLWNAQNLPEKRALLGHPDRVWSVAWSPDANQLASAGADGTVRIWDPRMLPEGAIAYPALPGGVGRMTFTPDGKFILASCSRKGIYRIDAARGGLVEQDSSINSRQPVLRFSPDGSLLAIRAVGGDTWVRKRGETEIRPLVSGDHTYDVLCWSPDSKLLATAITDKTAVIVDVESGRVVRRLEGPDPVSAVIFSPDGRQLAVARDRLVIYEFPTMERRAEFSQATSVYYSADSRILATEMRAVARVYHAPSGRLLHTFATDSGVIHTALSPDGKTLAIGVDQPTRIVLWDVRTGQELLTIEPPGPLLKMVLFSPSGDRLVASGEDENGKDFIWQWAIRRDHD